MPETKPQIEQLIEAAAANGWTVDASAFQHVWTWSKPSWRSVRVKEASNWSGRIVECSIDGEPQRGKKFAVALKELTS